MSTWSPPGRLVQAFTLRLASTWRPLGRLAQAFTLRLASTWMLRYGFPLEVVGPFLYSPGRYAL
eukprot:5328386-Pyramimonas_sp.AAC.1